MKAIIPWSLIFLRLCFGLTVIVFSMTDIPGYRLVAVVLLALGLMSDIFDGIIARRLGVSTTAMRRMDSAVDQVFFISFVVASYIRCPDFFSGQAVKLYVLLSSEALIYIVCYLKFHKEVATHSIGAKVWTLFLFAALTEVVLRCSSGLLFTLCFWIGLITRAEIVAIILILKDWTNDVPSVWHAVKLRQGREIKRHKLFNG